MTMRIALLLACATPLLSGCGWSEEDAADEAIGDTGDTAPVAAETGFAVATQAADGSALMAGFWSVGEDINGAQATFDDPSGETVVELACDTATRAVTLAISDPSDGARAYRLDAGGEAARIDMSADGSGMQVAEIDPTLAIFAAFSAPAKTVALTPEDGAKMEFPTHSGIDRVLYACM